MKNPNPLFRPLLRTALLCFALTIACRTAAQPVRGRLVDGAGRPVAGAAVVVLDSDSLYTDGTTSDTLGRFSAARAPRPYRLLVQHLSYRTRTVDGEADDAGTIVLDEEPLTVGEVVVRGERTALRIEEGKLSYDLGLVTAGKAVNNAYEALARLPGVSDRQGVLQLEGMGPVAVLLDGRPSTMSAQQMETLLRAMPAERIERAEVLYAAPPSCHVRGAAINLVLRRTRTGTFAGEVHAGYANDYYDDWNAGGNLLYDAPAWSAEATYSLRRPYGMQRVDLLSRHTLPDGLHEIAQRQRIALRSTQHDLRAAVAWGPEGKGRLSATYTGSFSPHDRAKTDAEGTWVDSRNDRRSDDALHNLALRYEAPFGLDLSVDYTHFRTASDMRMHNLYAGGGASVFDVQAGQRIDRLAIDADRERKLAGGWSLLYGASFVGANDRDRQHYLPVEGTLAATDTDSHLEEYTAGLYAGFSRSLSRGSLSLSLTGEYYTLGDYENWSFFPQAVFLWRFGERHLFQLTLSSDKRYPSYWEMQEAVSYIDGYAEIHGTPHLRPARNYSGQAIWVCRQKYVFVLFWNERRDHFVQTAWQAPDRAALVYQSLNWNTNRQWGLNAIVPFRAGERFDGRITLTGLRMRQRCDRFHDLAFDRSRWVGTAHAETTLRLSRRPDLTLEVSGYYQSKAIQGTYDVDPSWGVDAGAVWSFDGGRGRLTVRCTDLFDSTFPFTRIRYAGQWLDLDAGAYNRTFTMQLSYRFGGWKERRGERIDRSRFGH